MTTNDGMTMNVKNGKLIIEVDVSKAVVDKAPMSSSGKNKLVASTRGTIRVGDFKVGLNVMADAS
jgi:ssDNA-binding replication factor A large subunit